ncbi:MAG: hypothetical protein ACE5GB_15360 [Acidimicrobiales bacterium]
MRADPRPRRLFVLLAVTIVAVACGSSDDPYRDRVVERFDDGQIMDTSQAECVADEVVDRIDWSAVEGRGYEPRELFTDEPLLDQLTSADVGVLIDGIDTCRGADTVVLAIFGLQLDLDGDQVRCMATTITPDSSRDLLRLILTGDEAGFAGSGGELLLATCSR